MRQKNSQQILLYFRTRGRAELYFMGLTIRPKMKAKGRERKRGIEGSTEVGGREMQKGREMGTYCICITDSDRKSTRLNSSH